VASVGYVPGPLTAVAGESCLALVETAPDSPAAAWIWQQAGQGASAQALLAGLLGAGFEGVGGFTLLDQPAAGPRRLFCRGAVGGTVFGGTVVGGTAAEGAEAAVTASALIDGVGLLTWREHVVAADAERIYLGQPPDGGALWLPAAAGVLLAGCVIVDLAQTAPPAPPPPGVRAVGYPDAGSSGAGSSVAGSSGAGSSVAGSSGAGSSVAGSSIAGSSGAGSTVAGSSVAESPVAVDSGHDGSGAESAVGASPDAGPAVGAPAQPDPSEVVDPGVPDRPSEPVGDGNEYNFFSGATSTGSVGEAAIRPTDAVAGGAGLPAPDGWFQPSGGSRDPDAASSAPRPDAPPAIARPWEPPSGSSNGQWAAPPLDSGSGPSAAPPEPEGPGGLIDPGPWGAGPGAPLADRMPAPVVPPPSAQGPDEDGLTVNRADPVARPESTPDRIGPDVPALICPAGHVNPPSEAACRQCGAALPLDPVIVARPVLGVLRLSTGDVVTLDRDVVLGRNPPADVTGANGEGRPHAVRLPSADGVISRAHLRVTLSGWHVLVTDLNSTNGTRVTLPGRDSEQLPPGVPVPIRPGTVVALAEGVDFRFEDAGVS
jgi:FHA domain